MTTLHVSPTQARHFLRHGFALSRFQAHRAVAEVLGALEFVQEDSISVCARMHDLILWPRVADYTPDALAATLYGPDAVAFEYGFPNLCALPHADFPHFARKMRARAATPGRWHGLLDDEHPVAERFLAALDANGPLRTRAHGNDDGHMLSGWGSRATVVSQVAEKLWLHGTLAIARRDGFERYFDRTERVYPTLAPWLSSEATLPDHAESERHLTRKRLRAKRIFRPKRDERTLLGEAAFVEVRIDGVGRPWYALAEDAAALSAPPELSSDAAAEVLLLAPLDPLVYDRVRTREVFGFDYTWEVYVPAERRKWGYYVLPILQGDRLVGRLDPKLDRKTGTLNVLTLTLEPGVAIAPLLAPLRLRIEALATFLGATKLALHDVPPVLAKTLSA